MEDQRKVDKQEAEEYAENEAIIHMGTSAKTSMNVQELFTAIAKRLPKEPKAGVDNAGSVFDPSKTANKKPKSGCC